MEGAGISSNRDDDYFLTGFHYLEKQQCFSLAERSLRVNYIIAIPFNFRKQINITMKYLLLFVCMAMSSYMVSGISTKTFRFEVNRLIYSNLLS